MHLFRTSFKPIAPTLCKFRKIYLKIDGTDLALYKATIKGGLSWID